MENKQGKEEEMPIVVDVKEIRRARDELDLARTEERIKSWQPKTKVGKLHKFIINTPNRHPQQKRKNRWCQKNQ